MYGKTVLAFALIASFVTILYFYGSSTPGFQLPQLPASSVAPEPAKTPTPPCRGEAPLKVYMYDLPQRFNIGMFHNRNSSANDDQPVTAETLPSWPWKSGLSRQHSVEYWMMASLLYDKEDGDTIDEREFVRVSDPEIADAFFMPFFSSLSFNIHGHRMTDPETEEDKKLQVELVKLLRESKYWQRSGGRDHVIPMQHPNAFRFMRQEVNSSILIVVDFGRYPKTMSNLRKDVVTPYVHVVASYTEDEGQDPFASRPTLLFFRGRTVRKSEGVIRAKLAKILSGYNDVRYEDSFASKEGIDLSTKGMRTAKFCLHPAGDTPSSCRLFDAIVSHCVPVIISDRIELPYEDELDYSEFSIFISVNESLQPGFIVEKLRQVSRDRWFEMWNRLKQVSHHFEFQYPPKKEDGVNMLWRQVRHKLPSAKLVVHRSHRLKVPDWW